MVEVRVVGVVGPSGSGKSTVATYLAQQLRSPGIVLRMDQFYDPATCAKLDTWERPECLRVADFTHEMDCEILRMKENAAAAPPTSAGPSSSRTSWSEGASSGQVRFLVVEGFLLCYFPEIVRRLHDVVLIDAPLERRCCLRFLRDSGLRAIFSRLSSDGQRNVAPNSDPCDAPPAELLPPNKCNAAEQPTALPPDEFAPLFVDVRLQDEYGMKSDALHEDYTRFQHWYDSEVEAAYDSYQPVQQKNIADGSSPQSTTHRASLTVFNIFNGEGMTERDLIRSVEAAVVQPLISHFRDVEEKRS